MPTDILRTAIASRVTAARAAVRNGRAEEAWPLLEQAHVLSQSLAWPHIKVHSAMLGAAVATRDPREFAGQATRLVLAGPGSLLRRYPPGNSGRARVSAFAPSPIGAELQAILDQAAAAGRGSTG